jgi:hypothetical protein
MWIRAKKCVTILGKGTGKESENLYWKKYVMVHDLLRGNFQIFEM